GGTGVRVGRGGRGRRPREGNDERVDDLNGQGNDQGMGANEGVEGVNGNISGALTDEAVRNGSIKKVENRGNVGNLARIRMEERIRVLGPSVPPATPTMHPKGLATHASTITARVIWQRIVEAYRGM
ncbi:hypothetical protein Tco_1559112, partial [Tanacetum coccineum]